MLMQPRTILYRMGPSSSAHRKLEKRSCAALLMGDFWLGHGHCHGHGHRHGHGHGHRHGHGHGQGTVIVQGTSFYSSFFLTKRRVTSKM
jgi:hypothetical protein